MTTNLIIPVNPRLLATASISHPSSFFIPDSAWWWCMACHPGIHSNAYRFQSTPPGWCGWTDRSALGCSLHHRCPPAGSTGLGCIQRFSGPGLSRCRLHERRARVHFILLVRAYDSAATLVRGNLPSAHYEGIISYLVKTIHSGSPDNPLQ